jgi:predicted HAD superfamily Cof-like phosphohydrolase
MNKQLNQVKQFQTAFGQEINNKPTLVNSTLYNLRFKLMKEENEEYLAAVINNDLVEVADALGDMLYILCGTILTHGFQHKIEEVFDEIQRSNMSKLDENGKPIINGKNGFFDPKKAFGKVLKSSKFSEPNLIKILDESI